MLVEGTIIVIDLDRFEETVTDRGWSRYKPNPATGLLTSLVEKLVSKWQAVIIYGLDPQRGTEEVILEIPGIQPRDLSDDLEAIRREINKLGVGVSIVALSGMVGLKPAKNRREAYYGTPYRRRAVRLLYRVKRRGGNKVVVEE